MFLYIYSRQWAIANSSFDGPIHEVLHVTGDETRNMQEGTLWGTLYGYLYFPDIYNTYIQ